MAEEVKKVLRSEMTDQRIDIEGRTVRVKQALVWVQDRCEETKGLVYDVMELFPAEGWEDRFITLWKKLYDTGVQMSVVATAAGLASPERQLLSKPGDHGRTDVAEESGG